MYSSLDAAIANIKKFSRCKNFHYPNIPQVGDITDFKPEPKFNLTKDENYQEALAFINDNFTGKSKYYGFYPFNKTFKFKLHYKNGWNFLYELFKK